MFKFIAKLIASPVLMAALALGAAADLHAHTGFEKTVPAADSHHEKSPEQLVLEFKSPVRLMNVHLYNASGEAQDIGFKPSAKAAAKFSSELPKLNDGTYTVHWVSMGSDGHKMSGEFKFHIHSDGNHGQPSHGDHSQHGGQHQGH